VAAGWTNKQQPTHKKRKPLRPKKPTTSNVSFGVAFKWCTGKNGTLFILVNNLAKGYSNHLKENIFLNE